MNRPHQIILDETEAAGLLRHTAASHVGFSVPDVTATAEFYSRVLGLVVHGDLAGGGLRLGWGTGHHVMDLMPGDRGLHHFGFEIRDPGGIDALRNRLSAAGLTVDILEPTVLNHAADAEGIAVTDPDGNTVHFHGPVQRPGENAADTGRRPIKYQHMTLATTDVPRMTAFYVGLVGFRISDQLADGRFAWLRSNRDHHTLAIVQTAFGSGIDHYSYDLAEWDDFKSWCDRLTDENIDVAWGPGRHGPGNNLFVFFDDPAGNHIELSAEMEKFHDDRVTYAPRHWQPIPNSVNLWGGQLPTWRKTSEPKLTGMV